VAEALWLQAAGPADAVWGVERIEMPTVFIKYGYRFHFYSSDGSEPPHIHVDGKGKKAKIWLDDLSLAKSTGFTETDLRRITAAVLENREMIVEAWNGFFK